MSLEEWCNIFYTNEYLMLKRYSFLLLLALLLPAVTEAKDPKLTIRDEAYGARYALQSIPDPIVLKAGETKTVTVRFKNTGAVAWAASGARYVSAYTMEPRNRVSLFFGPSWMSGKQTGAILKAAKPGETAELAIALNAPATPGKYTEEFHLAAENHTWVQGGYFFLTIEVTPGETVVVAPTPAETPRPKANPFLQNLKVVETKGGEPIDVIIGFQNIGSADWNRYGLVVRPKTSIAVVPASFADGSWQDPSVVFRKDAVISKGAATRDEIRLRAPRRAGTYIATLHLEADGDILEDAQMEFTIHVTEDAPDHYVEPFAGTTPSIPVATYRLRDEPRIRVGLWKPTDFVQFRSEDADYDVFDGENRIGTLPARKLGVLKYDAVGGIYSFSGGGLEFATKQYIRLSPVGHPHAVFFLMNYSRPVKWKGPQNFNAYRGALEYRVTQDGVLYVINDLLLEDYAKGIGENGDSSPPEYLKAQSIAQRTYAYYVMAYSGKHDKRNFDVVAHTGDQLYLGYVSEIMMPRFVDAAAATRGEMVTYNNEVVITPYYGNSNGRTKSWTEVWGGAPKPWLVSVSAEYDKARGRRQLGHGVGMTQRDAAIRAEKEGVDYQALLKHYYTGVQIERVYE